MQLIEGSLVLSPTDLTKHLACPHVTTLDALVASGDLAAPVVGVDEQLELIFAKGLEHEKAYLASLYARGLRITEIPSGRDRSRQDGEAATLQAMREGVDVVYQATLFDGSWVGYADFLLRRDDRPSLLGEWSYDIADTKLARRLKVPALLQMATYAERLETLQGVPPERLVVVTGDKESHPWRLLDVAAYARRARVGLRTVLDLRPLTEAVPTAYCSQCRWKARCEASWVAADDLSLVAGMRVRHRQAFVDGGVTTVAELAGADADVVTDLVGPTGLKLQRQARLQMAERADGRPHYELLAPETGRGLQRLPLPDDGDVYLDFEGDPFAADGLGREYLAGLLTRDGVFHTWWAHDGQEERDLVEALLDFLVDRWRAYPGMHIYHYAAYEQSALKRLTGRYAVAETDLDRLLRGERFVDLYAVVKQGLVISKSSYSIKKMEDFYWGHTRFAGGAGVSDAMSSVVEYERFLVSGDTTILDRIRDYNHDDVRSTLDLHTWLESRRAELETLVVSSGGALTRPGEITAELSEDSEAAAAEQALAAALEEAGLPLVAGLVGWHRREDRPAWWEFFRRADFTESDLTDDPTTLGRVSAPTEVGQVLSKTGRVTSRIWRYTFPPQDCSLGPGAQVTDVDTRAGCGTIVGIDAAQGWVDLKRSVRLEPAAPRGIGPAKPISNGTLRASLMRTGEALLAGGTSGPAAALVARRVPTDLVRDGERPTEAVVRVGQALAGDVLAVQGPPGAGKTYAGSHLIRALLDDGLRVGVTALSHAVIRNLLRDVDRPALHKVGEEPEEGQARDGLIELTGDNATVDQALASGEARLVGGTAWLWARADLVGSVDVLVIDEAGQFSLANAVAVAPAARSIVLLGDPQQLTQPTQAEHPFSSGVSALEHLIEGADVIAPDRGLFLDQTWRMHPSITTLVSDLSYDGRLASAPGRERQRIDAPGMLTGAGVRWIPIDHEGNVSDSPEEAARVARLVADLLRGRWTDADGDTHPFTEEDVLVVAPYNAHVACLRAALPDGVRVGTVDKFQGQQAPVVIYAMASSSAHEAPRGVDFLYDVHRLNVAISRAKALVAVVASPALLDAAVHHPEQLRKVNALCLLAERAEVILPRVITTPSRSQPAPVPTTTGRR